MAFRARVSERAEAPPACAPESRAALAQEERTATDNTADVTKARLNPRNLFDGVVFVVFFL